MLTRLMRVWLLVVVAVLLSLAPGAAHAQAGVSRLMHEPIAYTDVLDALDGSDRLDLSVQLAYERSRDRGMLYREYTTPAGERSLRRVARAERELSRLAIGFELGLFHDVMAFVRLPLILGDARMLDRIAGVDDAASAAHLGDAATGAPLFTLPFAAPSRAGLDYLALGGAWALLNQMRVPWHSTWVLRIEGRRAIAAPLRACQVRDDVTTCGGGTNVVAGSGSSGASPGLSALLLETRFSRRYPVAEPFAGLAAQFSWPTRASRAFRGGRPGPEVSATLGVALIPWEDRKSFQRIALDVRLDATYVARGLAYGALFDALGTSASPSLSATPECVGGSCEGDAGPLQFRGVTEAASRLRYGGQLGLEVQAARYVRFAVGATLHAVTAHALSGRDACLSDGRLTASSAGSTPRCVGGRADPGYRGEVDAPGRRFFMRDELLLGGYAQATAMF